MFLLKTFVQDCRAATRRGLCCIRAAAVAALLALPVGVSTAEAQNPFAPVVTIDTGVITEFSVSQRLNFLTLLNAPGITRATVIDTLVDEYLQVRAAKGAGIVLGEGDVLEGLTEFAARAEMEPDDFVQAVGAQGIAEETLRDFIGNGLFWRQYIRQRYGARAQVTEDEIDRALALATGGGGVRVLLSEIALPLTPEYAEQSTAIAEELSRTIRSRNDFVLAAQRYSASPTAATGGELDWMPLSNLPPNIATDMLVMTPGQVTEPINMGGFIALFMLRGLQESAPASASALAVEYAQVVIPGGRTAETLATARALRDRTDTCDDLYGTVSGLPVGAIQRDVSTPGTLPRDLALELAKLDDGEVSTLLATADGSIRFVMMCGRTRDIEEGEREQVRQRLFTQRLEGYAGAHLDELRAASVITRVQD